MQFEPIFDPARLAIAAVLVILFGIGFYRLQISRLSFWRFGILTALRVLSLGVLLFILFNPVIRKNKENEGYPPFAVLLDTSRSMNTTDCEGRPRIEAVKESIAQSDLLARLTRQHRVIGYHFSERAQSVPSKTLADVKQCNGGSTAIAESLSYVLQSGSGGGEAFSGVLVLSDGQDNAGGDLDQIGRAAFAQGIPIWSACAGSNTQARDITLISYVKEDYVFTGHKAHIAVDIYQNGYNNEPGVLRLMREDKEILSRPVSFENVTHQRIALPVEEEERGLFRYTVSVDPMPEEADIKNNTRTVFVRAINEKIRVLLLESSPHWETKFLASALRLDENITLTSLFQLTDKKSYGLIEDLETDVDRETTRIEIPATPEDFAEYDVVVLGRNCDRLLTPEGPAALREYVNRGGNLIFARGSISRRAGAVSEFGALEPVLWGEGHLGSFKLELAPDGRMTSVFEMGQDRNVNTALEQLPEMLGASIVREMRPGARALAQTSLYNQPDGGPMAVITHQEFGKGSTLMVDAEGLWRWAFLREGLAEYDDLYNKFWGQIVRWLVAGASQMPGQTVSFRTDRLTYETGERVMFHVFNRQPDQSAFHPALTITQPDGQVIRLQPNLEGTDEGVYVAAAKAGPEGEYQAVLETGLPEPNNRLELRYTVYCDSYEDILVAADPERLRRLSEITGASLLPLDQLETLFNQIQAKQAAKFTRSETIPWWDTSWMLSLAIGLFGLEWFIRRRSGLY